MTPVPLGGGTPSFVVQTPSLDPSQRAGGSATPSVTSAAGSLHISVGSGSTPPRGAAAPAAAAGGEVVTHGPAEPVDEPDTLERTLAAKMGDDTGYVSTPSPSTSSRHVHFAAGDGLSLTPESQQPQQPQLGLGLTPTADGGGGAAASSDSLSRSSVPTPRVEDVDVSGGSAFPGVAEGAHDGRVPRGSLVDARAARTEEDIVLTASLMSGAPPPRTLAMTP